jgi:hypothetical protein
VKYKLTAFRSKHIRMIRPQDAQTEEYATMKKTDWWKWAEHIGNNYTAIDESGHPFACGGFIEKWPGCATVWMLMGSLINRYRLLWLTRNSLAAMQLHQKKYKWNRLETHVLGGFTQGTRWAYLLGFQPEGLMECYDEQGRDHVLFARIRKWAL